MKESNFDLSFPLPVSFNPLSLVVELEKSGHSSHERPASAQLSRFYDTFDWRLFKKNLFLLSRRDGYYLYRGDHDQPLAFQTAKDKGKLKFIGDFAAGALRDLLTSIIEMRALLPLLIVRTKTYPWEVRNSDDKIVLRWQLREFDLRRPQIMGLDSLALFSEPAASGMGESGGRVAHPHPSTNPTILTEQSEQLAEAGATLRILTLNQLSGYQKPWREARNYLLSIGLPPEEKVTGLLYKRAGYQPGGYSQKLNISIKPQWSARQATTTILRHQYQVMRLNEAGIRADLDTEFLHDYRVALRRSRAALTQLKGVLPAAATKRFRASLAELAKMSNRLRDLDVYLLKKEEYRQMLPEFLRPGLEPLFAALELDRRRELRKLVSKMKSPDYHQAMAQWSEFISADDPPPLVSGETGNDLAAPKALEPVLLLAKRTIAGSCARLLRHGRAIGPDSPDQALHELRLDCKKIRYLLEFFSPLFPPATISPLLVQTRKLQENLGTFNDLYVQRESLRKFLTELTEKNEPEKLLALAAAIGGLISLLHQQQRQERGEFSEIFKELEAYEDRRQICPEKPKHSAMARESKVYEK